MTEWQACTVDSNYGYAAGAPCVFLRLSNIHYWVPEPYNKTLQLPSDMPEYLSRIISGVSPLEPAMSCCSQADRSTLVYVLFLKPTTVANPPPFVPRPNLYLPVVPWSLTSARRELTRTHNSSLRHARIRIPDFGRSVQHPSTTASLISGICVQYDRPVERDGDIIWVTCDGEFSSDKENIGPVQVLPVLSPGFATRRLRTADRVPRAARNQPDHEPGPLVAVFFENPRRGMLINVECRVWARDIVYDPSSRVGRARFEIFVE
ncbi:hypothetical protein EVAR_80847_1 [Eumeta japonica]|uniref:Sodium/potassium-transporting ATPase subunit beta-2 n=1 Tax=Eumeta variegata TaxID=151549 RepID=A0A4C1V023_EUMVA|nr:hypothetical protein EVAR_80847_1 [Eumeta japonica]